MNRFAVVAVCLSLASCDFFQQAGDTISGLTNPLVALGVVMAVEPPESEDITLENTGYEAGTTMSVFLADAGSASEIENAPINNADVSLAGVDANFDGEGMYTVLPGDGLTYQNNADWRLRIALGDDYVARANINLPPAADFNAPTELDPGTDLLVDLTGQPFDSVLIVVLEAESGAITWSNEPETAGEIYDLTHGDAELSVTIPGAQAFPNESVYVLGVSGTRHTTAEDLEEMNTALSTLMSGKMKMFPISTIQLPVR